MSSDTGSTTEPTPAEASGEAPAEASGAGRSWYHNRFVRVAAVLLVVAATAVVLVRVAGAPAAPENLNTQLDVRLLTLLEEVDPGQHGGHGQHADQAKAAEAKVVCGVRTFGFEPKDATTMADVNRAYAFHLCGVAEPKKPWDWAVKLVGPLIVELGAEPPSIAVAEATETVNFRERVAQMFPPEYQEQAVNEFLTPEGMNELRRRYDAAAGL